MSWWEHRRPGSVSWSMVSLVAALAATLALGLSYWVPALRASDLPTIVAPGLLTVDEAAHVDVPLGDGYHVLVNESGLRVARSSSPLLDTATRGSLVSVLTGSIDGRVERVESALSNLRLTSATVGNRTATWVGTAYGRAGEGGPSTPVTITVTRAHRQIRVAVTAVGSDGVILHLDPRLATIGVPPALPDTLLRARAWWVTGSSPDLYTHVLGARVGVEAAGARAVDMRPDGLLDVHVWSSEFVLTVEAIDRPVADS